MNMPSHEQVAGHLCLNDVDPLLKLSYEIARGNGHVQLNLVLYLLAYIGKTNRIPGAVLERGIRIAYAIEPVTENQARAAGAAAEIDLSRGPQ